MAESRLNVMPSRMVLTALKDRLGAARTGYELLKKKSDALKARLQKLIKEILDCKRRSVAELKDAFFAHTGAVWAAGNINNIVIENAKDATYRVQTSVMNVVGVKLPQFQRQIEGVPSRDKDLAMLGLSKGGQQVAGARDQFTKTLDDMVMLASMQTALTTLDIALKVTNRKVNALEFVIIPQINNTIRYVLSELDELEREDQYRIKKVKDIRMRVDAEEQEENDRRLAESRAKVQQRRDEAIAAGEPIAEPVDDGASQQQDAPVKNLLIQQQQQLVADALPPGDDDDVDGYQKQRAGGGGGGRKKKGKRNKN